MSTAAEAYSLLGLERGADEAAVRSAFRRAVLGAHPDLHRDDPAAKRRFCELVDAYEEVLADLARQSGEDEAPKPRTFTPADFARGVISWVSLREGGSVWRPGHRPLGSRRLTMPTRDENLTFVPLWVLSVVIAILGWPLGVRFASSGNWVGLILLNPVCLYLLALAGSIGAVYLTRRVVYLAIRLGFRRALPGRTREGLP